MTSIDDRRLPPPPPPPPPAPTAPAADGGNVGEASATDGSGAEQPAGQAPPQPQRPTRAQGQDGRRRAMAGQDPAAQARQRALQQFGGGAQQPVGFGPQMGPAGAQP